MSKRVYILTCTWAESYGAVLQAYALATKIKHLGRDVEIINYQPRYYGPGLQKIIKGITYSYLKQHIFYRQFSKFLLNSNLLTNKAYHDMNDLKREKFPNAIYIVGSDQVWNCTKYYNGLDDAMFLNFVGPLSKRVSYAASLSMPVIPKSQAKRYKSMLNEFSAISVREKSGANILRKIGVHRVEAVIDPVFLIDRREWLVLANKSKLKPPEEEYMLIIYLDKRDSVYKYAQKKASMLGVKLFVIQASKNLFENNKYADKTFNNVSIYDYLKLISGAANIITDSFHAMSFSLIFNQDVDILMRNDNGNSRMSDLLGDLGLLDRITTPNELITDTVDYEKVNQQIAKKVLFSRRFLNKALGEE